MSSLRAHVFSIIKAPRFYNGILSFGEQVGLMARCVLLNVQLYQIVLQSRYTKCKVVMWHVRSWADNIRHQIRFVFSLYFRPVCMSVYQSDSDLPAELFDVWTQNLVNRSTLTISWMSWRLWTRILTRRARHGRAIVTRVFSLYKSSL